MLCLCIVPGNAVSFLGLLAVQYYSLPFSPLYSLFCPFGVCMCVYDCVVGVYIVGMYMSKDGGGGMAGSHG